MQNMFGARLFNLAAVIEGSANSESNTFICYFHRKLMLNPGIDINNVREVADFFGLVELCRMIDTKKTESLVFVEGTWVTRGPVLPALNYGYACYHHVFSRSEGNRLEFVPLDERQETLLVDVKDGDVGWVETTTGNIPRGAIRVGDGENMFIGKKKIVKYRPWAAGVDILQILGKFFSRHKERGRVPGQSLRMRDADSFLRQFWLNYSAL